MNFGRKIKKNIKLCQGCDSLAGVYCTVRVQPLINDNIQCPCTTCVVKGICKSPCPEYNNFYKIINPHEFVNGRHFMEEPIDEK
jgi:hypothetical protein